MNVIPEGGIRVYTFTVDSYLDEEGQTRYLWDITGDAVHSHLIGLLELVKHDLIQQHDGEQD